MVLFSSMSKVIFQYAHHIGYPQSFIENFFKTFLDKLFIKSPEISTAEKNILILSLPYLGNISLQTRTKLKESFKGILNCCKLQIVFKSQRKLASGFRFKDRLPYDLMSGVVYEYMCESCKSSHYGETDRQLKVRCGEHIGISPLSSNKIKPSKESAIRDHLLICNNVPTFDKFSILAHGNSRFVLEIKESLLIKQDKPVLNKNISSARLFLFDN